MSVHIVEFRIGQGDDGVMSRAAKMATLTAWFATGGLLEGGTINLFTNVTPPTPLKTGDEFDVPVWTGYAGASIVSNPPTWYGSFGATVELVSVDWESPEDADASITGAVLKSSDSDPVFGYALFDPPIAVSGLRTITVVPVLIFE